MSNELEGVNSILPPTRESPRMIATSFDQDQYDSISLHKMA